MSLTLEICLIILVIVTIVVLILVSVYLIKLLMELVKLADNMNDIASVVKSDIGTVISELTVSLNGINTFIGNAKNNVSDIKSVVLRLLGAGSLAFTGAKNLTGSFLKGLNTGLNLFKKK